MRLWIKGVVKHHDVALGELTYIFCSDDYILNVNNQYLGHDYYTDIITFNYNADNVSGDVYISIDTVKSNADEYANGNVKEELHRVVIHGVLHLLGFDDKSESEQLVMTDKENWALGLRECFT